MKLVLAVLSVHFIFGAAAFIHAGRKSDVARRKALWTKYHVYLGLSALVISSAYAGRHYFMWLCIVIFSGSFFEILKAGEGKNDRESRFLEVKAAAILLIAAVFFSLFMLLPVNIVIWTYVTVLIFDGASQVAGMLAGKHKIMPGISPGKTLEGIIGGFASALATAVILHGYAGIEVLHAFLLGTAICAAAFAGDAAASYLKREWGIKDFSNVLPGQGGILDRYDSFIASGALVGFVYIFLVPDLLSGRGDISAYLGFSLAFIVILTTAEIIFKAGRLKAEYLRMLVHVLTGFTALFLPVFLSSSLYVVSICLQSALFIYVAQRLGIFRSLHRVKRTTAGSCLFFIGILIAYLVSLAAAEISIFYVSVLVLTVCDPIASVTGILFGKRKGILKMPALINGKSIVGSAFFLLSALTVLTVGLKVPDLSVSLTFMQVFGIAFIATTAEALSPGGSDNVSIPLAVSLSLLVIV